MGTSYTLITGGSAGIGKACAEALAKEGRNLILVARGLEKLEQAKKDIQSKNNIDVFVYDVDVSDIGQVDAFFAKIKDKQIDVLINNAGLARGMGALEELSWADIEEMVGTNIRGFLRVAQLAIPFLKKTKGHIVNMSSIAGIEAYEGGNVYCGTKAFVKMLSKALRIDLHGTGVRVTDIAPGRVETEFSLIRFKGDTKLAKAAYEGYVPLKPEDIAECIAFCLRQPAHVNIEYMLVMPTAQASVGRIARKS